MTKRKAILLAILAVLCVVFALQMAFSRGGKQETLELANTPDRLEISSMENGSFALVRLDPSPENEADGWAIEENGFSADSTAVRRMLNAITSLKLLGAVSSDAESVNFGLDGESAITVEAFFGGESMRIVKIGKAAPTGAQTYAVVDGARQVQLVSGNIRDAFNRSAEAVRSRRIFSLDQSQIARIEVSSAHGEFTLERQGEPPAWQVTASDIPGFIATDTEATASWVSSVVTLTALNFEDEGLNLPETPAGRVVFALLPDETGEPYEATLALYAPEEEGGAYLGVSSECAQPFSVSSYTAERYLKNPADFETDSR